MSTDCTAAACLTDSEAQHYNDMPGGECAVSANWVKVCVLRKHTPDTPHAAYVQARQLPGGGSESWWLLWSTATGHREIKDIPTCRTQHTDPIDVYSCCCFPLGHGGECNRLTLNQEGILMATDELRDLLILTINRNTSTLNASAIEEAGPKTVIGLEHEESGELFFLEITQA